MYLFKKTPQNSAMIFLQKAEFVTPFLISHPCHFSYNSFYFFTCIGINSNFSCIPNPCAKRFIILNSEAPKKFFPYERIVSPNGKNGVVMIPKYKNNFLLLNQYRHAPRKMQYSFPRGFSEDNSTSSENAARELKEEIGATIVNEPILLGNVISDSGLTGNRVDVYLVEIESFQQNQLIHEGIKQIIEIPVNKMDDWIRQGKIDDGFSLSAYALYQSHIK